MQSPQGQPGQWEADGGVWETCLWSLGMDQVKDKEYFFIGYFVIVYDNI